MPSMKSIYFLAGAAVLSLAVASCQSGSTTAGTATSLLNPPRSPSPQSTSRIRSATLRATTPTSTIQPSPTAVRNYGLSLVSAIDQTQPDFAPPASMPPGSDPGLARDVLSEGEYLYVVQGAQGPSQTAWGRLSLVNIADPEKPTLISTIPVERTATDLIKVGNNIIFTDSQCEFGWARCIGDLYLVDVSDPVSPKLTASFSLDDLEKANPSPNDPSSDLSWYASAIAATTSEVVVSGNMYYPYTGQNVPCGLRTFKWSSSSFTPMGFLTCSGAHSPWVARDILVNDHTIFAAADESGIVKVDISSPDSPKQLGTLAVDGGAWSIEKQSEYLYVANAGSGFSILSDQDAGSPTVLSATDVGCTVVDVAESDGLAAVACVDGPTFLYDVHDPAKPRQLDSYSTGGRAYATARDGDLVIIADLEKGIVILKIMVATD